MVPSSERVFWKSMLSTKDGCARVQSMATLAVVVTSIFANTVRSFVVPAPALTARNYHSGPTSSCCHAPLPVSPQTAHSQQYSAWSVAVRYGVAVTQTDQYRMALFLLYVRSVEQPLTLSCTSSVPFA